MNCNVIQDLLVLYSDDCCSNESKALVEEHLKSCESCRAALKEMKALTADISPSTGRNAGSFRRIADWKASVMQSLLLFCSFAMLAYGVVREGNTPEGPENGLWAVAVIIPATGYLLSLANWYFIRLYPSKRAFSNASLITTLGFTAGGMLWAVLHYRQQLRILFSGSASSLSLLAVGIFLSVLFCVISKLLSAKYAEMLGKE